MNIGFIGLGLMGVPMAKNILEKGGNLFVWNRTPERANELISLGAKFCINKKELAASVDILITMVTAGDDVWDVLFSGDAVVDTLKKDAIVIDMSTIGVEWAEKIGNKLSEFNIHFIDAPVTGSTPKAITGELTIFIGGESHIYEQSKSILSMMGTNLQYMGKTGSGQAMKLVNNTLVAYSMIGLAEVMKLSSAMGISSSRAAEVIKTLPVASAYTAMKVDNFVGNDYPMMFSLANMTKDLSLAYNEMKKYGLALPMLEVAESKYSAAKNQGFGNEDVSAIGRVI